MVGAADQLESDEASPLMQRRRRSVLSGSMLASLPYFMDRLKQVDPLWIHSADLDEQLHGALTSDTYN